MEKNPASLKRVAVFLALLLVASYVGTALADTPSTMSFQGLLSDNIGDPVADGLYSVTFTIWSADIGGVALWSETQNVSTIDGLFSVTLGAVVPVESAVFDAPSRWLGIQVGADPEMTPRSEVTTAPFAFRTATIDGAAAGQVSGTISFEGESSPMMAVYPDAGASHGSRGIAVHSEYWNDYGLFYRDTSDVIDFRGGYGPVASIALDYYPNGGTVGIGVLDPSFALDVNGTTRSSQLLVDGSASDMTVALPDNSVNSYEMLNEPGFAFNNEFTPVALGPSIGTSNVQEFVAVTVTAPTAGYVVVEANCTVVLSGTTGENWAWMTIDTSGSTTSYGGSTFIYLGDAAYPSTSNYYRTGHLMRVFPVSAGALTFRAKGAAYYWNNVSAQTQLTVAQLKATFYPTSYGSVAEGVAHLDDGITGELVNYTDPQSGETKSQYKVDLRYYENQANEARIKALEAELELRKAEQRAKAQEAQTGSQQR